MLHLHRMGVLKYTMRTFQHGICSPRARSVCCVGMQVTFSDDVIVDEKGSPLLLLETGTTDSPATFYTGNGTSVLTFRSTIQVRGGVTGRPLS